MSDLDVGAVVHEAYTYLFPLVLMDATRRAAVADADGGGTGSAKNSFSHLRQFPPGDFRGVVRPNFDTLYSTAWLDLSGGPVVVQVPDTTGRYYMLPLLDMWTDVFAVIGTRTTVGRDRRSWTGDGARLR